MFTISPITALWRFFTGHHMHGKQITNATWTKRGTMPKSHLTWWTALPRIHRMSIRWAMVIVPVTWVYLFEHYHYWTVVVSIGLAPYTIHYTWHKITTKGTRGVAIPTHFERQPEESKITDLVFTDLPKRTGKAAGNQ